MVEASNRTSLLCRSDGAGLPERQSLKGRAGILSEQEPYEGVWGLRKRKKKRKGFRMGRVLEKGRVSKKIKGVGASVLGRWGHGPAAHGKSVDFPKPNGVHCAQCP